MWAVVNGATHGGKTLYIKIKDRNPSIKSTRQMRATIDTTQKKKKTKKKKKKKTNNQQKIKKKLYANGTHGY